ncbi:cytochrome-c peroxidase [Hydrogenophilus thermoluteolus]|nr:cytochrome-c peroxidase [Hydrogenophilus thermoluteolus]MBW7655971.1 cytochrome-c peroxidase [Hydrogenophilus thermoluteolus]
MKVRKLIVSLSVVGMSSVAIADAQLRAEVAKLIQPIQPVVISADQKAKVELGKQLFFDPRLSMSGIISCNTCHNVMLGGVDNLKTSIGHKWQPGPVNAPTVFNSKLNLAQFWDGRAANLKEQAAGPIQAPVEMAMPHTLAVEVIQSIPGYVSQIQAIYGTDKVSLDHITDAIAAYEETLVTPNSPFDRWLRGDDKAMTAEQIAGLKIFYESGCVACHNGPNLGGNSYQKMGVVEPYRSSSPAEGRSAVTKKDEDRWFFKVPTLRNVELTYPYFHDGEASTLEEAVVLMGRLQLGRTFSDDEVKKVVAFLHALTGERPQDVLPLLPASGPNTPRPDPFK